MNLVDAKHGLMTRYQTKNESLSDFYTKFKNRVEVIEHQGGSIGADIGLVCYMLRTTNQPDIAKKVEEEETLTDDEKIKVKAAQVQARERYLASLFLKVVSRAEYGSLLDDLQNQVSWGQEVMPNTLASAYDICLNYHNRSARQNRNRNQNETGVSFLQQGSAVAGTDGTVHPTVQCYACQKKGHYSDKCPNREVSGCVNATIQTSSDPAEEKVELGICCTHIGEHIHESITLLDNQSTHSIFRTKNKLANIRRCANGGLTMRSSGGGKFHTKLVGDYEPLGMTVWYSTDARYFGSV